MSSVLLSFWLRVFDIIEVLTDKGQVSRRENVTVVVGIYISFKLLSE